MLKNELKEFRLLKSIHQQFPEAQILRPNGSRKKLSEIFHGATEKKSTTEIFFQSTQSISQLSLNFEDDSYQGGAT